MARSQKIVDLHNLLAERFVQPPPQHGGRLLTGIAALDQATDGGLHKSQITEIISPQPSAGSALVIHCLLQVARRNRFFVALIDGRDSFDVQSASRNAQRYLFWIRCQTTSEALKASDFLLRDGNFPVVILDLILNPPKELRHIPATTWYRLQRLVEPIPTAFLVLSRHNLVPSAPRKIILDNQWAVSDLSDEQPLTHLRLQVRRAQTNCAALG